MKERRSFTFDREERNKRRRAPRRVQNTYSATLPDGRTEDNPRDFDTSIEHAEGRQIVAELVQSFIGTIEFYKTEYGGAKPHAEAVKEALASSEFQRKYVEGLQPEKVNWSHINAVAQVNLSDGLALWTRVREAADDELESGKRAAKVAGSNTDAYALAQFLAIRDQFADQWRPQGGIESAMIDMLTISFSLQMYWSTIAHERATRTHDEQRRDLNCYPTKGWKSPYQHEGNAIDQAHRLADGYNRQFLRVLRQLRDLRRYAPVVIQNNGGQVNVATDGGRQANLAKG